VIWIGTTSVGDLKGNRYASEQAELERYSVTGGERPRPEGQLRRVSLSK